jgi:hypothetical protein
LQALSSLRIRSTQPPCTSPRLYIHVRKQRRAVAGTVAECHRTKCYVVQTPVDAPCCHALAPARRQAGPPASGPPTAQPTFVRRASDTVRPDTAVSRTSFTDVFVGRRLLSGQTITYRSPIVPFLRVEAIFRARASAAKQLARLADVSAGHQIVVRVAPPRSLSALSFPLPHSLRSRALRSLTSHTKLDS